MKKQDRLRKRAATREKRLREKRYAKALKQDGLTPEEKKEALDKLVARNRSK